MTEIELTKAFYERLAGADAHGKPLAWEGAEVPTYTGSPPAEAGAPLVVIGRPRARGQEALDGTRLDEVRIQLRVHTAFEEGKGDYLQAYEIASAAHDLLKAAPIEIGGYAPRITRPDKTPVPAYDKGGKEALDLTLDYRFASL